MSLSKSFKPATASEVKAAPLTSRGRQVVLLTCYLLALLNMDLVRKSIDWYLSGGRLMRQEEKKKDEKRKQKNDTLEDERSGRETERIDRRGERGRGGEGEEDRAVGKEVGR